ncbi:DUF5615 family PIN-like protein [Tychonema sp. LEGE 07203]|uniref:DUF5615 family PIN-like protein n=1 Tax=Tychonema sp. LEGE 07203 TaxID=1828671 RepID=UPI00187F6ADB|nr:DUF5615 family PIN-like protein [Tychonema sp. LEGE 07203]MBE9093543.1 DUF5615 family PIN-like protein [Tychonema sp. LEGE 07203]
MRFLVNENFPLQSVRLLRQADLEVASVEDSPGIEDSEVLARAADEQRVILTFDRDYGELIRHNGNADLILEVPGSQYRTHLTSLSF